MINKLSQKENCYVIGVFKKYKNVLENDHHVVLVNPSNMGNLGTIMRIADWFGIRQIIASNDTVDVFNTKTIQATMGAISRVKVFYVNLTDFLSQQKGLPIYGTLLDGKNIYESELANNGLIIMGNEGKGISDLVAKNCDFLAKIPMYGETNSLNASVAAGIMIYEVIRNRK